MNDEEILKELEGRILSSIEFVSDYFQLRFDGPCLNIINYPKIQIDGNTWLLHDEKEFCYFLLKCLGKKILEIRFKNGLSFEIQFDNGFLFFVSMRPEDYLPNSAEALLYWDAKGKLAAVW